MTPEQKLKSLKIKLPPAPAPLGIYKPYLIQGINLYVSGHGPVLEDGSLMKGCVGKDIDQAEGKKAARQVGLSILSTLQSNLGSLDRVKRVIQVFGMVYCTPDFQNHPAVINGCSELFSEIWGSDLGVGVRSAVGMGSLPGGIPVEIEAVFELHPDDHAKK